MDDTLNKDNINNDLDENENDKPKKKVKSLKLTRIKSESLLSEQSETEEISSVEMSASDTKYIPDEETSGSDIDNNNEVINLEDTEDKILTEQDGVEVEIVSTETAEQNEENADASISETNEQNLSLTDTGTADSISTEITEQNEENADVSISETDEQNLSLTETGTADSNYQVSLIDERVLRVRTSTNLSVSIDCNVIVKEELQSNKIFIHPKSEDTKQEVEVLVKIGDDVSTVTESSEENHDPDRKKKESNYQVSLISENVLRIKISTNKSVSVDCSILDKTINENGNETQSNKIFIHPKQGAGKQDVEIFVRIGSEVSKTDLVIEKKTTSKSAGKQTPKLIPNPIVADILNRIGKPNIETDEPEPEGLTDEERLELKIGRKNPWRKNKEFILNNLYKGTVAANIIAIIAMILFYAIASKKPKDEEIIEQKRLIVMQDLPENLNKLTQNVDDPNKPPETTSEDGTTGSDIVPPVVKPKKIKPPKINLPKVNNTITENDSTLNKELDSLRKINNISGNNNKNDTGAVNTSLMPDSLLKTLSENEVGLIGKFPPNWKQIDVRDINQKSEFMGILLVDTTVKKEETMTMNIELDTKGDRFNQYQFKKILEEDSLRTIYSVEPKTEGKLTYYRFYVASKTDNVFVNTFVIPSAFEKYKAEIERVVKTINIKRPEKK